MKCAPNNSVNIFKCFLSWFSQNHLEMKQFPYIPLIFLICLKCKWTKSLPHLFYFSFCIRINSNSAESFLWGEKCKKPKLKNVNSYTLCFLMDWFCFSPLYHHPPNPQQPFSIVSISWESLFGDFFWRRDGLLRLVWINKLFFVTVWPY